jgi:hypothetical protein
MMGHAGLAAFGRRRKKVRPELNLQASSYGQAADIVPLLTQALTRSHCWLAGRAAISVTQTEFRFELALRSVEEFYGELMGSGVDLAAESHVQLARLCTLRRQRIVLPAVGRVIQARLVITFLEDGERLLLIVPAAMA